MKRPRLVTISGASAITVAIAIWVVSIALVVFSFYAIGTTTHVPTQAPPTGFFHPYNDAQSVAQAGSIFASIVVTIILIIVCGYFDAIAFLLFFSGLGSLEGRLIGRKLFNIACFLIALGAYGVIVFLNKSVIDKKAILITILPFLVILAYWIVGAIFLYLPNSEAYFKAKKKGDTA